MNDDQINRPRGNRQHQSRENIRHHFDIGKDFYRLWLDEQLVYTCAYFPDPSVSLETAQVAKMDHVCRKLDLRLGERVIEAGCGWEALALLSGSIAAFRAGALDLFQVLFNRAGTNRIAWTRAPLYHP